jgi:hypothetical protein
MKAPVGAFVLRRRVQGDVRCYWARSAAGPPGIVG